MKVCIFAEGSYPYAVGGSSAWVHMLITHMPDIEFAIQTVIVDRSGAGKFKYNLPPNVTEVKETYLNDDDIVEKKSKPYRMNVTEKQAFRNLIFGENIPWDIIFNFFYNKGVSVNDVLMGVDFYEIVLEYYKINYHRIVFTDFLWTLRSIFLPVFILLKNSIVEADVYHTISTGYAGMFAACAKQIYNKPMMLTEHGIYTREREEEIIRVDWTHGMFKDLWISNFYKLSYCTYDYADWVVSLFDGAQSLQTEIGCDARKTEVIPNGIELEKFADFPQKETDNGYIDVGAVVRVSPIKDIKTMLTAFSYAKEKVSNLRLFIMGPADEDPGYYQECMDLLESLGTEDVTFTGRIDIKDHLGKMDIVLLTSISEGQPLSVMEAMATQKPCVTTRVGDCYDILNCGGDAPCGIVVPVMNIGQIAGAIVTLAENPEMRKQMGVNGYNRVVEKYQSQFFIDRYKDLYQALYTGKDLTLYGRNRLRTEEVI